MHPAPRQRPELTGANEEMAAQPAYGKARPTHLPHHLTAEETDEAVAIAKQPDMGLDGVVVGVAEGVQIPGLFGLADELFQVPTAFVVTGDTSQTLVNRQKGRF